MTFKSYFAEVKDQLRKPWLERRTTCFPRSRHLSPEPEPEPAPEPEPEPEPEPCPGGTSAPATCSLDCRRLGSK